MNGKKITRKDWIKRTTGLAAGMAFGCSSTERRKSTDLPPEIVSQTSKILNHHPEMSYRLLGRTGLVVSEISLGGHYFYKGKEYMTQERRNEVVAACLDAGINFFETTETPDEDETAGMALRGKRNEVYITHDFATMRNGEGWSKEETLRRCRECIETGLKNFHTDCIDLWRPSAQQAGGSSMRLTEWVVEAGLKAKQQGKIRFLGISSHDAEWLIRALEEFDAFDVIITPYNYCFRQAEGQLFSLVRSRDLGVMAIKPFLGESLFRREIPQWNCQQEKNVASYEKEYREKTEGKSNDLLALNALKYILSRPEISVVVPGMSTAHEVRNNVKAARSKILSKIELEELETAYNQGASRLPAHLKWLDRWRLA